jgi:thioredoxin 1
MDNEPQSPRTRKDSRVKTLALVIGGVIVLGGMMTLAGRNQQQCGCSLFSPGCAPQTAAPGGASEAARPRLLDLGATQCIPCKMMAPVLDELKEEYAGRLDVEFLDVWQYPNVASEYGIESIPVQIFFDATGKEVYRHQGFFAKEDILKKWKELGVDLTN